MKRLDDLFNKARNTPPPLSRQEAENIIAGAAVTGVNTGKIVTLKRILFISVAIISAIGFAIILNTGGNNKPAESTVNGKQQTTVENSNFSDGERNKTPLGNEATGSTNGTDNTNKLGITQSAADTPGLTRLSKKPVSTTKVEPIIVPANPILTEANPVEEVITKEIFTEKVPLTPVETEPEPVIPLEETLLAVDSITLPNTDEKTDDSTIAATTGTTTKKPAPPERFPQILVKTDLLGYFHNSYQNRRHTNYSGFDARPYWGNRVTLGGELLLNRRFSWEITGTYGFPYGYSAGGTYEPGKPSYELYKNYKGWIFNTGIKYFIIKGRNAGAGLYIGPYASVGYLQERVLYFERNTSGENKAYTISVSKGRSVGYGAFAGYRLMHRNWFIEPQAGLIIDGKDRGYYNQAYFGQETWRYGNLWRIEFSAGYKF